MKNNKLPNNLTLQDFQRLAERQPNLEGNWIYRLIRTTMDEYDVDSYPFDLYEDDPIWFLTFQEVEERIKEIAAKNACEDGYLTYCFFITQFPLGCPALEGAQWLYDQFGNLLDYTITTCSGEILNTTFFGRPEKRNRFKRGDIVEVLDRGQIKLAVLLWNPRSTESCWNTYRDCISFKYGPIPFLMHAAHDSCYLLDRSENENYLRVSPLLIMKPRFHIPEDLEMEMKGWLNHFK